MLPFPVARPTGHPPSASQDPIRSTGSSPVKPPILPLHTNDKPLPPSPQDPSSRRTIASSSGEDTQRGLKGWWKRNRQRSKGNLSPGQAELGVGSASKASLGSQRTRYDVDVLTKQLGAVNFGNEGRRAASENSQYAYASPVSRAAAIQSSPATYAAPVIPDSSRRSYRPPVYAPHVGSEHLPHSVSAPQLEAYSIPIDVRPGTASHRPSAHSSTRAPHFPAAIGGRHLMTTFEPDSRALERLPDRPATYMDVSQRFSSRPLPQQSLSSPTPPSRQIAYPQGPLLPLTPSRKPNASFQSPRTPISYTPSGYTKSNRSFIDTPESQQSLSIKSPTSGTPTTTVQCAGFTQKGKRCKKRVRTVAAYYSMGHAPLWDEDVALDSRSSGDDALALVDSVVAGEEKRFCNVHIGQISSTGGFYKKRTELDTSEKEKFIQFSGEHAAGRPRYSC